MRRAPVWLVAALSVFGCGHRTPEFIPSTPPAAGEPAPAKPPEAEAPVVAEQPPAPAPSPATIATADPGDLGCPFPNGPPRPRSAANLTVPTVPGKKRLDIAGRLRAHVDGALSSKAKRVWIGPPVPEFVPLTSGTLELFLLDPIKAGYFALYRDPYGASSCTLSDSKNCAFEVAAFDCSGRERYRIKLDKFLSRRDHLEVQDARSADDIVYFNEACQSYSNEAKGKCSSLVALDPKAKKVLWRTPPLTSNNRFLVDKLYIVSGYGFTAEDDFVFIVRRSDGKIMQKLPLPSAHEDLIEGNGGLVVQISSSQGLWYRKDGFDGPKPKLEPINSVMRDPN